MGGTSLFGRVKKILRILLMAQIVFLNSEIQANPLEKKVSNSVLRIGSQSEILPLNPFNTYESISVHLLDLVFNKLVRLNNKGEIEPDLAYKWEISDDGKTYTFYLRDEIYFHNKAPFSSGDVLYSYERYLTLKRNSPYLSVFNNVESVEADPRTVVFHLKKPYAPFLFELKQFCIVPAGAKDFDESPTGTGPFRFVKWNGKKELVLEKFPNYYEGCPKLNGIVIKSFGSVENVWSALMRDEVDMALYMNQADFEIVRKDTTYKTYAVSNRPYYYALAYNHSKPLVSDRRFRLAIAHAINKKKIILRALNGYATECNGPFLPESWAENKDLNTINYNPQKSKKLLNELGFKDVNGDGILEYKNEQFELKIVYHGIYELRNKIAYLIRQNLQEIGVKTKIIKIDDISQFGLDENEIKDFDFEIRTLKSNSEPSLALTDWLSGAGLSLYYHYNNTELDNLIYQSFSSVGFKERQKVFAKIHFIIQQDQPITFLFFPLDFFAVRNEFSGVEYFFNFYTPYHSLKDWAQETSARKGDGGENE